MYPLYTYADLMLQVQKLGLQKNEIMKRNLKIYQKNKSRQVYKLTAEAAKNAHFLRKLENWCTWVTPGCRSPSKDRDKGDTA